MATETRTAVGAGEPGSPGGPGGPGGLGLPGRLPPMAWLPVGATALAVVALLLTVTNRYGYHRDELYFRMLAAYPDWGYVDQPPLTPLIARGTTALFGDTLFAMRVPAAIFLAAFVILTALAVREFGGAWRAQTLAAIGAGFGTFPLVNGHVLVTSSLDLAVWAAVLLCVLRALLRDRPQWWLAAGVVAGLSLYNKQLLILLSVSLLGGLLISGRRVLRNGWLWAGLGLAVLVGAPNIVYQATHDWPQWTMARAIADTKGEDARIMLIPLQLVLLGLPLLPIWIAGLLGILRDRRWRAAAPLGWAYLISLVVVFATGGQPYYPFGLVIIAFAAGCVRAERWLTTGSRRALVWTATALSAAFGIVLALPVLPPRILGDTPIPAMITPQADQVGWPAYVAQVGAVWRGLPASDADRTVIITGNYGEAGAIDRFGGAYGLPAVYSGHNELWFRARPPESATVAIIVGIRDQQRLGQMFGSCTIAGELDNGVGVDNEEQEAPITICRDPASSWSTIWPRFQHFS